MKLWETPMVHPELMQNIAHRYPSLCTIGNIQQIQDAANQPIDTFIPNPEMGAIRCYVQPAGGTETREAQQTVELNQWIIGLNGFYPEITVIDQATVDGLVYNIQRVAHDDHESATYLTAETVDLTKQINA